MNERPAGGESPETRLKRLLMRSRRRGMREMDLILGAFADARLAALDDETLDRYEELLEENDQDLYKWVSGAAEAPARHAPMLASVAAFHRIR